MTKSYLRHAAPSHLIVLATLLSQSHPKLNFFFYFRPVLPSIEPGYLQKLMPGEMPEKGEKWQDVMDDFKNVILPGVTHWQSPKFMAYFPSGQSFPSIVGDILAGGLASVGFSWVST